MFDPFDYIRRRLTESIVGSVDDANAQLRERAQQQTPHLVAEARRIEEPTRNGHRRKTARR